MKKIVVLLPLVALLAIGCSKSTTEKNSNDNKRPNNQQQTTNTSPSPTPTTPIPETQTTPPPAAPTPASTTPSTTPTWQGTLEKSNNQAQGNYMIMVDGSTIYLNTRRDYSSLIGKPVTIHYTGTLEDFILTDITAQ